MRTSEYGTLATLKEEARMWILSGVTKLAAYLPMGGAVNGNDHTELLAA